MVQKTLRLRALVYVHMDLMNNQALRTGRPGVLGGRLIFQYSAYTGYTAILVLKDASKRSAKAARESRKKPNSRPKSI